MAVEYTYKYISYKDLTENDKEKIEELEYAPYIVIEDDTEGTTFETMEFDAEQIMLGSLQIDNACVDSQKLVLGSVYMGELRVDIDLDPSEEGIASYYFIDKKLTVYLDIEPDADENDTEIKRVKLGEYYIAEANKKLELMSIRAYDGMIKLEKKMGFTAVSGTPANLLASVERWTGITLAQTQTELNTLSAKSSTTGAVIPVSLNVESGSKTYRSFISEIATLLGCFAFFDFDGKLRFKRFPIVKNADSDDIRLITASERNNCTISDYNLLYHGIKATIKGKYPQYTATGQNEGKKSSNYINIGELSFLQQGLQQTIDDLAQNIADAVGGVSYSPFDCDYVGDPFLELGELIYLVADDSTVPTVVGIVTHNTWVCSGWQKLKAVGENPYLAETKTAKDQINEAVADAVYSQSIKHASYTNADSYSIVAGGIKRKIIEIETAFGENAANPLFHGVCIFNVEVEGTFTFYYRLNGEYIAFTPKQTITPGMYTMNLFYPVQIEAAYETTIWQVEVDSQDGQASIASGNIIASISGSAMMMADEEWDGKISLDDMFRLIKTAGGMIIAKLPNKDSYLDNVKIEFTDAYAPIIPVMTSANHTDDYGQVWTASASVIYLNGGEPANFTVYYPYFDNVNKYWAPLAQNSAPQWLQIDAPKKYFVGEYAIRTDTRSSTKATNTIQGWQILGSNDGETWDIIDEKTNQNIGDGTLHTFTAEGPAKDNYYSKFRLLITAGTNWMIINKWQLYGGVEK